MLELPCNISNTLNSFPDNIKIFCFQWIVHASYLKICFPVVAFPFSLKKLPLAFLVDQVSWELISFSSLLSEKCFYTAFVTKRCFHVIQNSCLTRFYVFIFLQFSGLPGFWWEIHSHLSISFICNLSLKQPEKNNFCLSLWVLTVWLWCVSAWFSLRLSYL